MKRFLHALAALWPERRGSGSPPVPDTHTGILQHWAAVLRMDGILSECAHLPIREWSIGQPSESADPHISASANPSKKISECYFLTVANASKKRQSDQRKKGLSFWFVILIAQKFANTYSFSDIYVLTKRGLKARNLLYAVRSWNSCVIAFTFLFMCLIAALEAPAQTGAAANLEKIQPLQIGDTIPEYLWHLPLQVVNHPEGKETITLNDYRGKLIILDFWATWCGICIDNIPTMLEYQKKFGDEVAVLHVSPQSRSMVLPFLEKRKDWLHTLSAPFYSALDTGRYLFSAFPSEGLPNLAIINYRGKVVGQVRPRYINETVIAKLLEEDEHTYLPTTRSESYVKNRPLMRFAYDDVKHFQPIYYSSLLGIVEGWAMWGGTEIDTLNNTKRRYSLNSDLLSLYGLALNQDIQVLGDDAVYVRDFIHRPQLRILEVEDPDHYKFRFEKDWMRSHIYSYEALLPADASEASFQERLRYDLDNLLGLEGRIEKRSIECLVLRNTGGALHYQTQKKGSKLMVKGGLRVSTRENRRDSIGAIQDKASYARTTMKGFIKEVLEPLDEFYNIKYNKQNLPLPVIIDETGYEGQVFIYLPDEYPTIEVLRKTLSEQGLDLKKETREMYVFVLTQKGYQLKPNQRYHISPHGYLPAEHVFFSTTD